MKVTQKMIKSVHSKIKIKGVEFGKYYVLHNSLLLKFMKDNKEYQFEYRWGGLVEPERWLLKKIPELVLEEIDKNK